MEILTSQAVLTIFGILAVYFGVKLVAVAFRLWTPRHRSLTMDEAQLKGWRRACALESAGLACLWLGLLLGLTLSPYGYALAVAGAAVFAACKAYLIKKYPYIDPDTVKKSGKKRKK